MNLKNKKNLNILNTDEGNHRQKDNKKFIRAENEVNFF